MHMRTTLILDDVLLARARRITRVAEETALVHADLATLESPRVAEHHEVLTLIERSRLWGRGIGWVDAHLLASVLLDRIRLWTLDARLARVARELGVAA